MFCLCDVTSMYASAEKVFDPRLRSRPVVVLSNNDGCIIAVCPLAKRLGIQKFVPFFQARDQLAQAGVVIRSSNYELYADLSNRFMAVCSQFADDFYPYSIDECFLGYGPGNAPAGGWEAHGADIRRTVWKLTRLPIGVGFGPTLTLAKAANHAAKRLPGFRGVAAIDSEPARQSILAQMAVTDVWGIGARLGAKLNQIGIYTALELAQASSRSLGKRYSIKVEQTIDELNGQRRLHWDDQRAAKQAIFSTRTFGTRVDAIGPLRQAIAGHVHTAAHKLRQQGSLCRRLVIFAGNSPHDPAPYYHRSGTVAFPAYTNDTQQLLKAAGKELGRLFRPGVKFYRCGVGLMDIVDASQHQPDLFQPNQDRPALMACLDRINDRYGRGTLFCASQGIERKFEMRREFISPRYTTRISDLPRIKC